MNECGTHIVVHKAVLLSKTNKETKPFMLNFNLAQHWPSNLLELSGIRVMRLNLTVHYIPPCHTQLYIILDTVIF